MITTENVSSSEEQLQDENKMILNDYFEYIMLQMATIEPDLHPLDYIEKFKVDYLQLSENYDLSDNKIYVNDSLSEQDHEDILKFVNQLTMYFENTFGILLKDTDMNLVNCLYKTMVVHFVDTFVYYINGLQKVDGDFINDLPEYDLVSFKYFKKINPDYENKDKYIQVRDYLDYVLDSHIYPDLFFQIALLESSGNVDLSPLYIESVNDRIVYDLEFFILKMNKLLSSINIKDSIMTKLIDTL